MVAEEEDKEAEGEEGKEEGEGGGEEGATEGGEGGDSKKKKGGKKKLIILIAVIALILGGAGGAFYYFKVIKKKQQYPSDVTKTEEGGLVDAEGKAVTIGEDGLVEQTVYYDMEEFVVNLNVGSKRPSFLKMTISLELPGESQIPPIEEKMPRIRDSFQVYLRELRQDDLQGSAGMYRLREELLLRINKIVYPAKVNDILFKEILVQ
jgi:flagellar FliL protein